MMPRWISQLISGPPASVANTIAAEPMTSALTILLLQRLKQRLQRDRPRGFQQHNIVRPQVRGERLVGGFLRSPVMDVAVARLARGLSDQPGLLADGVDHIGRLSGAPPDGEVAFA